MPILATGPIDGDAAWVVPDGLRARVSQRFDDADEPPREGVSRTESLKSQEMRPQ